MTFNITDDGMPLRLYIFIIIAIIINIIINGSQMIQTFKTKSVVDFSDSFILFQIIINSIWLAYSIEFNSFVMLLNNIVCMCASIFMGYYKVIEIINRY
jgi:hypothetical protein